MTGDPCMSICADRCAEEFGDPPCWEVHRDTQEWLRDRKPWTPCADCMRDAGIEVTEPLDPEAAIRPLL